MENNKFQVVLEHLVRMTQEITEIKSNQLSFSQELAEVKSNQLSLSNRLTRIENDHGQKLDALSNTLTRIENDHGQKLDALFDARQVQLEVNEHILTRLFRIEEKLDNLSIKVAQHDLLLKNR